ncbi:hypothetical protein [Ensifer soli]|uniref:hypothetical protein n=1 Tax=Ciceribacter sp. sgz301302 TaxID=3342379 RepID=UPI0035BB42DC
MTDLIDCIKYIKDGIAKMPPSIPHGQDGWEAAWSKRQLGFTGLARIIERDLPKAKIIERGDVTKVSIMGVRSTSTGGMHGALNNWMAAARRKLDKTGFIQTSGEKERV